MRLTAAAEDEAGALLKREGLPTLLERLLDSRTLHVPGRNAPRLAQVLGKTPEALGNGSKPRPHR